MLMVSVHEVWSLWFSLSYANQDFRAYMHNLRPNSVCLSVCLSVYLSAFLSVYLSAWLPVCLSVFLSFSLSFCPPVCLYVCLSVFRSVFLTVCLSVCLFFLSFCLSVRFLSVFLSIRLSVCLSVWVSSLDLQVHISFYQLLMSMWGYCGIPFCIDVKLCIDLKVREKESQGGSRTVIYGVKYTVIRKNTVRWRKKK